MASKASDFVVEVRDRNFIRMGQIAHEFLDLQMVEVFRAVGAWQLKLPAEHPLLATLKEKGSGIIVTERAQTPTPKVFSGRMQSAVLSQDAADPKGTWLVSGVDDNIIAAATRVLPDPTNPADAQTTAYWNYAGTGEVVMKQAVLLNAGASAIAARKYPWLTVAAGSSRGSNVSASARFDKLGDLLASLGAQSGLGWRFAQDGPGITFDVFEPSDKSAWVRLDIRNGGLQSTELGYSAPSATNAYVLGQGQGEERTVRVVTDTAAAAEAVLWGLRWEVAKDQRNTDDPTELQKAGEEILDAQGTTVHSLKVTPSDAPNQRIGIDWGLGDIITVIVDDDPATATVTEIATSITKAGVIRTATVGDPVGYDWEAKVSNAVRQQETRISALERLVDSGITWDGVSGKPARLQPGGQQVTDWDSAVEAGFYWANSGAPNSPVAGGLVGTVMVKSGGPTPMVVQEVLLASAVTSDMYKSWRRAKSLPSGPWTAWVLTDSTPIPDTGWLPLTLQNSFTAHPSYPPAYRVQGDDIALRGAVYRASTAGVYTVMATMPTETAPLTQVRYAGRADAGQSVAVINTGEIQMLSTANITGGIGLMLDGISWKR